MNRSARLLTPILVAGLAACGSGGAAAPRAPDTTDGRTSVSLVPADPPNNVELPDDHGAWQQIVLPGGPPGCVDLGCSARDIVAGDAGLVAMGLHFTGGSEAFVGWSSSDGLLWQQIKGHGAPETEGFAAAGPGFVAARSDGIFTSSDGASWDRVRYSSRHEYLDVSAGGAGVVAVGSPGKAWFSSDAQTWEAATVPPTKVSSYMTQVAAGGNRLVATGWMGFNANRPELVIWVSSDGMSWRDVPIDGDIFPPRCRITDVAGGRAGFVATGWCGVSSDPGDYLVWRSDDGVNWSRVGDSLDGQTPWFGVSAGHAGFIGTNGRIVWTSVDGASWTRVPTGSAFRGAEVLDVTAWGSRLVAVGDIDDGHNLIWISGPQHEHS